MTGTFIQPNLHTALVHYPIALITLGVILEIFSFLWSRSGARTAGRWMIVFGVLFAVPSLTSGLYALRQTVGPATTDSQMWDLLASGSSWSQAHWHTVQEHIQHTTAATLLMLIGVVVWIACSDSARQRIYLLGIVVMVAGAGLFAYGAHEGGKLVYEHRTGVQMPVEQATSGQASDQVAIDLPGSSTRVNLKFSPLEVHAVLAGLSIAVIAAALGLSVRRSNVALENRMAEEKAVAAGYRPAGRLGQDKNLLSIPMIYPGRFWTLALILLACTAAMGLYMFGVWRPAEIYQTLHGMKANDEFRPFLHGYTAAIILSLVLFLGILLRFWPRRRFLMGIFSTLLVIAVIAQAWTGILMLFDGHAGPLLRFNEAQANQPVSIPVVAPTTMPEERSLPTTRDTLQTPVPTTLPAGADF